MIGYTLILSDTVSSNMAFLPDADTLVYTKLEAAIMALKGFAATLNTTPILYGETFPYEDTSFEAELEQKGFAIYGIGDYVIGDEMCRVPIGLKRVAIV